MRVIFWSQLFFIQFLTGTAYVLVPVRRCGRHTYEFTIYDTRPRRKDVRGRFTSSWWGRCVLAVADRWGVPGARASKKEIVRLRSLPPAWRKDGCKWPSDGLALELQGLGRGIRINSPLSAYVRVIFKGGIKKLQAPTSKLQRNSNIQAPNPKPRLGFVRFRSVWRCGQDRNIEHRTMNADIGCQDMWKKELVAIQDRSDQGFAARVGGLLWRADHGMINFVNCRADATICIRAFPGIKASL